jgi:cytoskeletal protein CcmA (bactofilin family)
VEIQPKGIVTGEIHAPCIVIEPGGIFDGQCHMLAAAESSKTLTIPIRAAQQG